MGRRANFNAQPKNGPSFYSWNRDERIPTRDSVPAEVTAARKRIEDLKLAREVGVPVEAIL